MHRNDTYMRYFFHYAQRSAFKGNYKANNTSIYKTNLSSLTPASLLPCFSNFLARNVCYFAVAMQ